MKTDPSISGFIELGINMKTSSINKHSFVISSHVNCNGAFCVHTYPFDVWFILLFYLSDYFSSAMVSYGTQTCITLTLDN